MTHRPVLDLKAFVPARNFVLSRQFYLDLGFTEKWGNDQACELQIDGFRILLQNFYVKEHAENFMMHLMVENADEWWEHIQSLGLAEKYSLSMAKPPTLQPWGLRVLYLTDPTGVLWHIADRRHLERSMKTIYLACAIAGAIIPYSQFVPWLAEHGPDAKGFILELFSTRDWRVLRARCHRVGDRADRFHSVGRPPRTDERAMGADRRHVPHRCVLRAAAIPLHA